MSSVSARHCRLAVVLFLFQFLSIVTNVLAQGTPPNCEQGFFNTVTLNALTSNIQSFRNENRHLLIANPAMMGSVTAGSQPTYFAAGGYFDKPFLRFSKSTATGVFGSSHNYIGPLSGSVSFGNGLTVIFVVRFQSELTGNGGDRWQSFASFFSMQRNDEHSALNVNVCKISNIVHMCFTTYQGATCARADAPLGTWMQFTYTYHPSALPRGNIRVEYTSLSVQ
jgi:hypothetical protein